MPDAVSTHVDTEVSPKSVPTPTTDAKPKPSRPRKSNARILSFNPAKVSTHFATAGTGWKKSAKRPGALIKRVQGYDIAEDEYGVSYLYVVTRTPKKRTSADFAKYEHAGFFTWKALEMSGKLRKEITHNGRKRLN